MREVYLDNAATTPLSPAAYSTMQPYLTQKFGNADSRYASGREAALAVLSSRDKMRSLFGGAGGDVYFTSCGSEANSWALKGVCAANYGKNNRIILSAIEHPSLLRAARDMEVFGYEVVLVNPDSSGIVRPEFVADALKGGNAAFVGVMYVNNETGVIQPVKEIYDVCRAAGAFYFCDCVQAAGTLVLSSPVADGMSISAHKFYGPKGVGALWLKKGARIERLVSGGQQEGGLRGGTTNVAGICGMAAAYEETCAEMEANNTRLRALRDRFVNIILSSLGGTKLVGSSQSRVPSNANIAFAGCRGEQIMINLDMLGVAVSTGSACSSGASKPSPVLMAMGLSEEEAASCVRFTFGRYNTEEDVTIAAENVIKVVNSVRVTNGHF